MPTYGTLYRDYFAQAQVPLHRLFLMALTLVVLANVEQLHFIKPCPWPTESATATS